jgi:hypothetical protein
MSPPPGVKRFGNELLDADLGSEATAFVESPLQPVNIDKMMPIVNSKINE